MMIEKISIPETVLKPASSANIHVISEKGSFRVENIFLPDDVGKSFAITGTLFVE